MKITIFTNNLEIGGIEKALFEFIKRLKEEKIEVQLYVLRNEGTLKNDFSKIIEINEIPKLSDQIAGHFKKDVVKYLKKMKFIVLIRLIYFKFMRVVMKRDICSTIKKYNQSIDGGDIAICYQVPIHPLTIFISEKVKANKKILWNHAELMSVNRLEINKYNPYIQNYDRIFSVSETTNSNVKLLFPNISYKCFVYYNYIDIEKIKTMSNQLMNMEFNPKYVNIVTVGRLSYDKAYDILMKTAKILKEKKLEFRWYIIGEGEERVKLTNLIRNYNLDHNVFLLGRISNPYPYMKNCDLYVQTSRFEGYGLTTTEALVLKKIVISTNTSGIEEKIKNNFNGFICEVDEKSIADQVWQVATNEILREKILCNLNTNIIVHDNIDLIFDLFKEQEND